jgi:hypothetical protein
MRWALLSQPISRIKKLQAACEARHQRNEAYDGQSNKRALDTVHLAAPRFLRLILASVTTAALTHVNRRQHKSLPRMPPPECLISLDDADI